MTEDEARAKWCPFAQSRTIQRPLSGVENAVAAYELDGVWGTTCIGSACMAWRWKYAAEPDRGGYCGLAGSQ